MKTYILPLIVCFVFISSGFAQSENISWTADLEEEEAFIENHGQFDGRNWQKNSKIEYGVDYNKAFIFFTEKGLTYRFDKIIRNPNRKKEEHDSPKRTNISELIHVTWVGANQSTEIITEDLAEHYYSYAIKDLATKEVVNVNNIKGYKKLTYKNLYDNIDVEYIFHPESGIKYSIILHPGADASKVKMKYSSGHTSVGEEQIVYALDENGELQIKTSLAEVTEHKPFTFYKNSKQEIKSGFNFNNNILSFDLGSYDNTKKIVIDPWVISSTFTTSTAVWEVETDGAGNVYVIGGETPMQLKKFNSAGTLQWIYTTPWDTAYCWLGTLATDNAGVSYITSGTAPEMERIDSAGSMVWHSNGGGGLFGSTCEWWSITFNCDKTKLIVGGTYLPSVLSFDYYSAIYDIDITNGNVLGYATFGMITFSGFGDFPIEVRSISSSKDSKYIFLTHEDVGAINQNIGACPTDAPIFQIDNGHHLAYKCENYLPATQNGGGLKALVANDLYFYTHSGDQIHQRLLIDGSLVTSVALTGGNSTIDPFFGGTVVENSGLDVDDCGNVYAGSGDRVVKFDENLNFISEAILTFLVYDISVNSNGEVLAVGAQQDNQVANRNGRIEAVNMSACAQFALVCCDANMCPVDTFCSTDPAFDIDVSSPGGIFSGPGITDSIAGTFDPSVAGGGIHTIDYTMGCGSGSIFITVNICATLTACLETNGDVTVSGGTSPYTWENSIPPSTTPITNQTECVDCGYTWFIFQCVDGMIPVSDCTVPASWAYFATGTTVAPPGTDTIRVTDTYGNFLVINDVSSLPSCSPCSLTVTASSTDEICGQADGTATATPSNGTAPYTYSWNTSPSQTNQTATGLTAGIYIVTVTDNAGCTETGSVTVNSSGSLTVTTAFTDAGCAGGADGTATATPSSGTAPYTYLWDDPQSQTNSTATSLPAGTYGVTVTDAGGCIATGSATIGEPSAMVLTPGSVDATCGNPDGEASVSVSGGAAPYSYQWSDPASQVTATATGLFSGSYTVIVTDDNGCQDSATANINDGSAATLSITDSSGTTCFGGNDGSATVTPLGGTPPYTYLWDNGETSSVAVALTPGSHTVTVTDANGCIATVQVIIDEPIPINAGFVTTDVLCNGGNDGTATVTPSDGTPPYSYLWNDLQSQTNSTATGLTAGIYNVIVTDNNACDTSFSVTVSEPSPVAVNITGNTVICSGNNAILDAGSGFDSYLWSTTQTTQSITVNPIVNTTYSVIVYSGSCQGGDSVTVVILPPPQANITGPSSVCLVDSVELQSDTAASYVWLLNDSIIIQGTAQTIFVSSAGDYQVVVTNACGTDTSSIHALTVVALPDVDAGDDVTIDAGTSVQLNGSGGPEYSWSPSSGLSDDDISDPVASPTETTTYELTVTDANGCSNIDEVIVTVTHELDLWVPDIFSPNGDMENDVLYVYGKGIKNILFIIYDRWGEKVYEAEEIVIGPNGEIIAGWDGTFRDKPLDPAVFVYYLEANDGEIIKQGNITLVR
ncbi:MAG: gliding motility-associated C-terminal domain-containing protein [Bacteroidota bacterium]